MALWPLAAWAKPVYTADLGSDQGIPTLEAKVAAAPDNLDLRYHLGVAYNERAVEGDEAALDRAIAIMRSILADDPANPRARAMLGSCTVMKAEHASVFDKLDFVEEGYTILDTTVAKHPENPEVRMIRAINASLSPGFLGRSDIADADFDWLLANVEAHPEDFDDNYRRTICYYAGNWFVERRDQRAVGLLLTAAQLPGAPRLTDDIASALKRAKKRFPTTYAQLTAQP